MAIEKYSTAIRVSNSPSMTEVINKKGFTLTSGIEGSGKWKSSDGLLKLCKEDINPNVEIPHPTISPCSLLSFSGYAHFYKVMPSYFVQNEEGCPEDYRDYVHEKPQDTAWIKYQLSSQGSSSDTRIIKEFPFEWMPLSFRQGSVNMISHLNPSWLTPDFVPGWSIPRVTATRNSTYSARKTYIGFTIGAANGIERRSYGVYIHQPSIYDPGEGGGSTNVVYPSFLFYSAANTPIGANNSTNPILLKYGTFTFYIGGHDKLSYVTPIGIDNSGLKYDIRMYDTPNSSGDVGTITITVPADADNSLIGFMVSNGRSTIYAYFGFNKMLG